MRSMGSGRMQLVLVALYIFCQAVLNLYMKYMMSMLAVAKGLFGLPASFLVTGLQQLVALFLFLCVRSIWKRTVGAARKPLTSQQRLLVLMLAVAFSLNMSLNNFSLAFIPLSVNQVIRACMPLATAVLQAVAKQGAPISGAEWACMVIGVVCAASTVLAKCEGQLASSGSFLFGTALCLGSVLCGAGDLVMKQTIGTELKLSPINAMGLMALPAFIFLLVPGCFWQHPVPDAWAVHLGVPAGWGWTDKDVLLAGVQLRPSLLAWIAVSGMLAFGYNIFSTFFAVKLSATTASFVGNFPTSTLASLLVFERNLPGGRWFFLFWASILGNIAAFVAYNQVRRRRLKLEVAKAVVF